MGKALISIESRVKMQHERTRGSLTSVSDLILWAKQWSNRTNEMGSVDYSERCQMQSLHREILNALMPLWYPHQSNSNPIKGTIMVHDRRMRLPIDALLRHAPSSLDCVLVWFILNCLPLTWLPSVSYWGGFLRPAMVPIRGSIRLLWPQPGSAKSEAFKLIQKKASASQTKAANSPKFQAPSNDICLIFVANQSFRLEHSSKFMA